MNIPEPPRGQIPSIGLTKIWAEGQGVDRVSRRAVITHVVRRAFENIARSPVTASLTVVTITIALFMLGIFLLVVENTRIAVASSGGSLTTYIFIKETTSSEQIASMRTELEALLQPSSGNQKIRYVDKEGALATFRKILGEEGEILDGLEDENPLPVSLEITSDSAVKAEEVFSVVSKKFSKDERVESVRFSQGTVQQLRRLMRVVEVGGGVGVVFLLLIT